MNKKEWVSSEVKELISEYELHPELWDPHHRDYQNRAKKHNSFTSLANKYHTTKDEVIRKMHNLKNQFSSEMRKIITKNSRAKAEDTYISNWPYLNHLMFLAPIVESRASVKSLLQGSPSTSRSITPQVKMQTSPPPQSPPQSPPKSQKSIHFDSEQFKKFKKLKRLQLKIKIDSLKEEIRSALACNQYQLNDNSINEDRDTIFGKFIASELRHIQSDHIRDEVKWTIQVALREASQRDTNERRLNSSMYSRSNNYDN